MSQDAPNMDDLFDLINSIKEPVKQADRLNQPNVVFMDHKDYMYNIRRPKMKRRGKKAKQLYGR